MRDYLLKVQVCPIKPFLSNAYCSMYHLLKGDSMHSERFEMDATKHTS